MNGTIFAQDTLTSRQRLLAAYRGQEVDRLPYWAKVTNSTWRTSQPQFVRAWSDLELLDYIYADGLFSCPRVERITRPHVAVETYTLGSTPPDRHPYARWRLDRMLGRGSRYPLLAPR